MILQEIKKNLEIRYSKALYLGHGRGLLYHFFYGYKRILIEVMKSFFFTFTTKSTLSKERLMNTSVSLHATDNQRKCLLKADDYGLTKNQQLNLYRISRLYNILRLAVWIIKFVTFPVIFFLEDKKEGAYFYGLCDLMVIYNRYLRKILLDLGVTAIAISNDHSGDIFILSLLFRKNDRMKVTYIQHGAAKKDFPKNYFDQIFVYDQRYIEVYRKLSFNPDVTIHFANYMQATKRKIKLPVTDVLICYSHQFPIFESIRLIKKIQHMGYNNINLRFHPSDRLKVIKVRLLNLFYRVRLSNSDIDYKDDFKRAKVIICASSSLLLDAYNSNISNNLIWLKSIGLSWDYYDLESKILICNHSKNITKKIYKITGEI